MSDSPKMISVIKLCPGCGAEIAAPNALGEGGFPGCPGDGR